MDPDRPDRTGEADKGRRDFTKDCLRSGCHASLKARPWLHAPVAVGACEACHREADAVQEHKFEAARPPVALCMFCHTPRQPHPTAHDPHGSLDCTRCHDPHGGASPRVLQSEDERVLCGECHDATRPRAPAAGPSAPQYAALHKPIADGKCLSCHRAHASQHAALLVSAQRELCLSCHESVKAQLAGAHIHTPVIEGCLACHGAHGGEPPGLLVRRSNELCLGCHEAVAKDLAERPADLHGALKAEDSCVSCHLAHAGSDPALVPAPLAARCLGCHDRVIELPGGRRIRSVASEIAGAKHLHGPAGEGDCGSCHRSHSSPHRALLAKAHPAPPYSSFSESAYELCFSCHDKALVEEEPTTLTGFRDGERNLHRLHVHRDKGRTCDLCHAAHSSRQPQLIRDSVPFGPGGWSLPLRFESNADGGACGPGCHQAVSYRRGAGPRSGSSRGER